MCMQRLPLGKQNRTQHIEPGELKMHVWSVWMTRIKGEEEEKIHAIHIQQL